MNVRTISTVALPMGGYPSLEAKWARALELANYAARDGAELMCFPELSNSLTGLLPEEKSLARFDNGAADPNDPVLEPFIRFSKERNLAVVLPLLVWDRGERYNAAIFIDAGRVTGRYDKVYPTMPEMDEGVRPGKGPVTVDWRGVTVGFAICFDINYPELARAYGQLGARLLLFPTMFDGGNLVNANAFLNGYYCVSSYAEWSRFVDPFGETMDGVGLRMESWRSGTLTPVLTRTINFDFLRFHLAFNQEKFAAIKGKYGAGVRFRIEQGSALAVLESWMEGVTAEDVAREFGLETMDAYLARSAARALGK